MWLGKALETVEAVNAPVEPEFFRRLVKKIDPPALVNAELHDVAFDFLVANFGEKFRGVFTFKQSDGVVSAQAPFGVFGPACGDAHSGSRNMLAKDCATPVVIGNGTVPGPGWWRCRSGGRWDGRVIAGFGNRRKSGGGAGSLTIGEALRQHLLNHLSHVRGCTGDRLLQERRRLGMATARKKKRAEILRGLRGAWIELQCCVKTALCILELSQRDLHRRPIVPKLGRGRLGDAVGEELRSGREVAQSKERFGLLKD